MSVILSRNSFQFKEELTCSACGEKGIRPPLVRWMGKKDLYFCTSCCRKLRHALVSDFIHAVAVADIQKLYPGYTLVRTAQSKVDAKEEDFRSGSSSLDELSIFRQYVGLREES